DVAEKAGRVSGGDVERSQERNGEMLEVAADALPLEVDVVGGLRRSRELVAEGDVRVDPVHHRLHPLPGLGRGAEEIPGDRAQAVDLAVAARQEEAPAPGR